MDTEDNSYLGELESVHKKKIVGEQTSTLFLRTNIVVILTRTGPRYLSTPQQSIQLRHLC